MQSEWDSEYEQAHYRYEHTGPAPVAEVIPSILRAAADYMLSHEFVQGEYFVAESGEPIPGDERHKIYGCCARGAIHAVADEGHNMQIRLRGIDRVELAEQAIQVASDHAGEDLDEFNDAPGRAKDEVVDLLRSAADSCFLVVDE